MESIDQFILIGGALVAVAIIAGMFSSRLGAPLLLVFLALGMLAGEDGPGGIRFNDYHLTFLIGSVSLAIILFDGGLRTPRTIFKIALAPALSLATVGILVTAAIAGAIAVWMFNLTWLQGLLVGATIASTDAAAVFLLLHARGTELSKRVQATLELESGINDPMAVFLTILCVELLLAPAMPTGWNLIGRFAFQMAGGVVIGVAGGYALLWLINRVEIAPGLYPILAASIALTIFAGAQVVHSSGYVAVYVAGLVLGNNRHRAQAVISRFHDGLAWLAQIVMFLLLGLLSSPATMQDRIWAELAIAVALILVARPVAVWLSLAPFRFAWRETAFISWVGLRGAVPIFLASIPVIMGVPDGTLYFNIAFVVVLVSLAVQGWTVTAAARFFGLALPPAPEVERHGIDMPASADRDAASWTVAERSPALEIPFPDLPLPRRTRIIAVIRDGTVMHRETLARLEPDDTVIALAPPEQLITLDKLFSTPLQQHRFMREDDLGEFVLDGSAKIGEVCAFYGVACEIADRERTLADVIAEQLHGRAVIGDRIQIGAVQFVVREFDKGRIVKIGLELEPEVERLPVLKLWTWLARTLRFAR